MQYPPNWIFNVSYWQYKNQASSLPISPHLFSSPLLAYHSSSLPSPRTLLHLLPHLFFSFNGMLVWPHHVQATWQASTQLRLQSNATCKAGTFSSSLLLLFFFFFFLSPSFSLKSKVKDYILMIYLISANICSENISRFGDELVLCSPWMARLQRTWVSLSRSLFHLFVSFFLFFLFSFLFYFSLTSLLLIFLFPSYLGIPILISHPKGRLPPILTATGLSMTLPWASLQQGNLITTRKTKRKEDKKKEEDKSREENTGVRIFSCLSSH